jgi:hypothetical protein
MLKKWVISLSVILAQPAFAVAINVEQVQTSKFIEIYRKFFEKEMVADLSATRAELNAVLEKRNMILDYMNDNNLKISEEDLSRAWQVYIKKNFKSIDEFGAYLEKSFIKEFDLKERFKQNLYFSKYFDEIISPRINKDFELRKKIFEIAETNQIDIPDKDFQEALYQMAENWGGMDSLNNYLTKNNISIMDISFYIKSDLLKNKILDNFVEKKLASDTELASSLESSSLNEYSILNQRHKPLYFFRHAYISKDAQKADEKIDDYYKKIQKNDNPKLEKLEDSEIKIEAMNIYIDPNSDLVSELIKDTIIKLSDDGLFVSKKISPVISSKSYYHIFQLSKIIVPENENLQEIKNNKISKLRCQYANNLNLVLDEITKKTSDL